ncbi:MAG: replication factor C small subunit [Candidatus Aenigmarchaeota archaeon]|nr:replication factor C small subunit [Candidatus Aenigmarchaeota archaeon]
MLEEIWTEKYRPKKLGEVVGQEEITKRLESFVKNRSLPHCLFAGPAGVGKTTSALAIARELFGDGWKSNFLELNASDERGIDTVRVKIKDFARTMPLAGMFKIVYLDEADSLTKDAQHALRRTMENYATTCRFILACNYSSRIILPIQSRTAVFRFSPLKEQDIEGFLKRIAAAEKLSVDAGAYKSLVYLSEGDMRRAVNIMQTAAAMDGAITEEVVYAATNRADPKEVSVMLESALSGNFREARNRLLSLLYERGLASEDIIKEIYSQTFSLTIEDEKKLGIIEKIGEYEFRLTEGSNPQIQLEALLAQIGLAGKK